MIIGEKHENFRQQVRDFAEEVIAPRASEYDKSGEFPEDLVKKLGEKGFLSMFVPVEYGGQGLDNLSYAIAVEEISRVCGSMGITVAAHNSLGVWPILEFGTDAQREKYLPMIAKEAKLSAFALTEPEAGSDAAGVRTTAVKKGDSYVIDGTKCFITSGGYAHILLVAAKTDPEAGTHGISNFIVERDTKGFSVGKVEHKLGLRGSNTVELIFDSCEVPADNLLGKEGDGFKQFMMTLDGGRVSIAAMALGIAQGAFEAAMEHARKRIQFDRPIGKFQAIQWKIADMAAELDAARMLVYKSATLEDMGKPFSYESAVAKLFASEKATRICRDAIQVVGGRGYLTDYPLERFYRDVKLCEIGEGTSEIQRVVIARHVLGK
jgi:hypothetical protein